MTDQKSFILLAEILSVVRKYDHSDVMETINFLRSLQHGPDIATMLENISKAQNGRSSSRGAVSNKSAKKTPSEYLHAFLASLESSHGEKNSRIASFVLAIASRECLPNSRQLLQFAESLGQSRLTGKIDRKIIAKRIGESLLRLSDADLDRYIDRARQTGASSSSLQDWSNLIVKK